MAVKRNPFTGKPLKKMSTAPPSGPNPDVVRTPVVPAQPGRRVGKNTSPGTPRKVGAYAPVMPTQAKKKAPAKRK
jgi:hypothetical protein